MVSPAIQHASLEARKATTSPICRVGEALQSPHCRASITACIHFGELRHRGLEHARGSTESGFGPPANWPAAPDRTPSPWKADVEPCKNSQIAPALGK